MAAARPTEIGWWAAAAALVPIYANAFPVWPWLLETLPARAAGAVPVVLVLALAGAALGLRWRVLAAHPGRRLAWALLSLALAGTAFAWADPAFPAKRVHVAEYALLALVLRRALVPRLGDPWLAVAAAGFGAALGFHDELLQGLHGDRYFGAADIGVNAVSAAAGSCLGAALAHRRQPPPRAGWTVGRGAVTVLSSLALVALGTGLSVAGAHRLPFWGWMPPLAVLLLWATAGTGRAGRYMDGTGGVVATAAAWTGAAALAVPVAAAGFGLPFL